jgi:hypothetical protein
MTRVRSLFNYFQRPFPAAAGFSPYRFPGLAVHLPILFTCLILGWTLCIQPGYLWPLMLIYLVVGLYLGRDWAILAHYNPFIMIGAWLALILILHFGPRLRASTMRLGTWSPVLVLGISLVIVLLFGWHVRRTWDWFEDDSDKSEAK